jgi:hypothetical protein
MLVLTFEVGSLEYVVCWWGQPLPSTWFPLLPLMLQVSLISAFHPTSDLSKHKHFLMPMTRIYHNTLHHLVPSTYNTLLST